MNPIQLDRLSTCNRHAADRSALALARWLGAPVGVRESCVALRPLATAVTASDDHAAAAVVLAAVHGSCHGTAALFFGVGEATAVVSAMGVSPARATGCDELGASVIRETANIAITAYLNQFGYEFALPVVPQTPVFAVDLRAAAWEQMLLESAIAGDRVLSLSTCFACSRPVGVLELVFTPDPACWGALVPGVVA